MLPKSMRHLYEQGESLGYNEFKKEFKMNTVGLNIESLTTYHPTPP